LRRVTTNAETEESSSLIGKATQRDLSHPTYTEEGMDSWNGRLEILSSPP
jgi:hypothetical protein